MSNQLFLDSFHALAGELEANVVHLLTHPKQTSDKLETLSMELLSFKSQVFTIIAQLISNGSLNKLVGGNPYQKLVQEISAEVQSSNGKLLRYRLHHILKRKMAKKRRELRLNSSNSIPTEDFSQLEQSVILIEKDLGLEDLDEDMEQLTISNIISRSILELEGSINTTQRDYSMVSEANSIDLNQNKLISQQTDLVPELKEKGQNSKTKATPQGKPPKNRPLLNKKTSVSKTKADAKQGLLGNLLEQSYQHLLDNK